MMEYQTDALTVIVYTVAGVSITALCFLFYAQFKKLVELQEKFSEEIRVIKLDQALHMKETETHHERLIRLERLEVNLADDIVAKLKAITPR